MSHYDAVLVVSFGGPEGPDDVMPFLRNVLRGRNVPERRMRQVAEHYHHFGGVSPINANNRALVEALSQRLATHGPRLPVYFGNRHWHPLLPDVLRQMRDDGVRRALGWVTSLFSSYSGCRAYLDDLERARAEMSDAPVIDKLRQGFNHPGFVAAMAERVSDARARLPGPGPVCFTAHSIPLGMSRASDYVAQLQEASGLVAQAAGVRDWTLVYQSRSGPPGQPWLEPDILAHLEAERERGIDTLVIAPIGFVSDHMEVVWDLDTEARQRARELGIEVERAATVGTHPHFVGAIHELIRERTEGIAPRWLGTLGPRPAPCAPDCCRESGS